MWTRSYLDVRRREPDAADIPTFERALRAMDEGDLAWLGFKVVYDAAEAQRNTDNEVTKKYGDVGLRRRRAARVLLQRRQGDRSVARRSARATRSR